MDKEEKPYKLPQSKHGQSQKPPSVAKLIGIAVCFVVGLLVGYILAFGMPTLKP